MVILDKPRHADVIKRMQKLGVKVMAIPDGDVAAAIRSLGEKCKLD